MDYTTVKCTANDSFTEKHSGFTGYISPTETEEEAIAFINSIRAMHRKATHNVYAYILRRDNTSRYSDDGEPQGTAGVPVYDVLRKEGLTDVCVVVTRYFGGVLLGGGGLVRAYSRAAKLAVDAAGKKIMQLCVPMTISADYSLYGKLSNVFPNFTVKLTGTDFADDVKISLLCASGEAVDFEKKLVDIANGRIIVQKHEECYEDFT